MKKGCSIGLAMFGILIILLIIGISTAFGPDYNKEEIEQNIGGILIANSVYNADHQSWRYDINYKYKTENDSIYDIGNGTYDGREWDMDEQIMKYGKWGILKTGGGRRSDKLLIGHLNTQKWKGYEFTPENIERAKLWKSSNTHSFLNYCCPESYITEIENGKIELQYKFHIDENNAKEMGIRTIFYEIDIASGKPEMVKVSKPTN